MPSNKLNKVNYFYQIYLFLILIMFVIFLKFIFDFYKLNQKEDFVGALQNIEKNEMILSPRFQVNSDNGLEYIQSEKGYIKNNEDFLFENVNINTSFGYVSSGKAEIIENKNILNLEESPKVIIYLNDIEEK